jgi:hypothetical protein
MWTILICDVAASQTGTGTNGPEMGNSQPSNERLVQDNKNEED